MHWLYEKIHWVLFELPTPDTLKTVLALGGPAYIRYLILAAIVFSETGLLVGFFLPGDSLLFTAGLLASQDVFQIELLMVALSAAAILGDAVNYYFGLQLESHVLEKGKLRFVKHDHLVAAKEFYEKWGPIAIVYARFVPFVRTFTPFVAGVGRMGYRRFAFYNVVGGIGWVVLMTMAGYLLGGVKFVSKHFEPIVLGIVAVSLLPVVAMAIRAWQKRRAATASS